MSAFASAGSSGRYVESDDRVWDVKRCVDIELFGCVSLACIHQPLALVALPSVAQYIHESRHRHALNRVRGEKGRFVTMEAIMEAKEKTAEPADKDKTLSTSLLCSKTPMPQLVHGMDVDFDQSFAQLAPELDQCDDTAMSLQWPPHLTILCRQQTCPLILFDL